MMGMWWLMPLSVWGGLKLGVGVGQAITGWEDDE
jgi:hypothetical protein